MTTISLTTGSLTTGSSTTSIYHPPVPSEKIVDTNPGPTVISYVFIGLFSGLMVFIFSFLMIKPRVINNILNGKIPEEEKINQNDSAESSSESVNVSLDGEGEEEEEI